MNLRQLLRIIKLAWQKNCIDNPGANTGTHSFTKKRSSMQNPNEKQTAKKPSPEQSQQDMQKKQGDKKMTGQQQNIPNKSQQQDKKQQEEKNQEDMGSGKRQDDN